MAHKTARAWDMVGWDDGPFRIQGGRAHYEAVMFNCGTRGEKVLLAKLTDGLRQVNRYVDGETILEFFDEEKFQKFHQFSKTPGYETE